MNTMGELDFRPLLESHRRAKDLGVPPHEIEFSLDMLLADIRKTLLADDDRCVWHVVGIQPKSTEP